jgi:hypothetical protein
MTELAQHAGRRPRRRRSARPPPKMTSSGFTIGMTFQVSDTNIESKQIRRAATRHAWVSFPFGAVIIATSINLVSGLAK